MTARRAGNLDAPTQTWTSMPVPRIPEATRQTILLARGDPYVAALPAMLHNIRSRCASVPQGTSLMITPNGGYFADRGRRGTMQRRWQGGGAMMAAAPA